MTNHPTRLPQWMCLLCLLFALLQSGAAHALQGQVQQANSQYTVSVEDLRVKVLGGDVKIKRTWQNGQWYVNPAWADLKTGYAPTTWYVGSGAANFVGEIPPPTYSLVGLKRANSAFMPSTAGGAGVALFAFDERFFIKPTATGFQWSDPQGNTIDYGPDADKDGKTRGYARMLGYADRNGVKVSFTYDANGNRTDIRDHFGNVVLGLTYTGSQLDAITDRSGRTVRYQYDAHRNLVQVTDVLGNTSRYTYDDKGQILTLTDAENRTTTIAYDVTYPTIHEPGDILRGDGPAEVAVATEADGMPLNAYGARVGALTDPLGNTTTYQNKYVSGSAVWTATTTSPAGKTASSSYNRDGKLIEQKIGSRTVFRLQIDKNYVEISYDERGLATRTQYDRARNPLNITYPDGTRVETTYDPVSNRPLLYTDQAGVKTQYSYDAKGNLLTLTEALGLPEQRITTYTYDQAGQRLTRTRKGTTLQDDATTSYTYDSYGNVASITDALGNQTIYTYDAMGKVLTRQDARGNITTYTYNAAGWRTGVTDALDHATNYAYDKVGNRITITDAFNAATQFTYDGNNRLTQITDALGGISKLEYDADGRQIKKTDRNGVTIAYQYDADGRPQKITDGNGNMVRLEYASGLVSAVNLPTFRSEYQYDQRNRVTQTTQVLDAATRFTDTNGYDATGNLVSQSDALGHTSLSSYDALGQLIQDTDALGGLTHYAYDSRGNLLALTDANGNMTRYGYDLAGNTVSETRPSGAITRYSYDKVGNLATRTDAKGQQRVYTYDAANRRIQETHYLVISGALSSSPSQITSGSYDERNHLTGYDDGITSATYTFDVLNRKIAETVNYGPFSKTQTTTYYPNGLKKSFTYADGSSVGYAFDANNQIKALDTPGGAIGFDSYKWTAPTKISTSGATRTMTYDGLLRPTGIKAEQGLAGSGQVLLDYRYVYNAVSDILQKQTQDGITAYGYDKLDRLTDATPPVSLQASPTNPAGLPVEQYAYDAVGNRTSSTHQPGGWAYTGDNQLIHYGQGAAQTAMQYDPNGHLIKKTTDGQDTNYQYNVAERLVAVTDGSDNQIAGYTYDPFGRRIKKTANGQTTYYQYSAEGLTAEYDESGNQTQSYGWLPDALWGTNPQFKRDSTGTYFYINDHLGTSQQLIDTTGKVVWSGKAKAFGNTVVDAAQTNDRKAGDAAPSVSNNLRFAGQYFDAETGTHYNFFRDYDSATGRYIQSDPIGLAAGPNTYAYVGANPVINVDPDGLRTITLPGTIPGGGATTPGLPQPGGGAGGIPGVYPGEYAPPPSTPSWSLPRWTLPPWIWNIIDPPKANNSGGAGNAGANSTGGANSTEGTGSTDGTDTQDVTKRPSRVRRGTERGNWENAEDGENGGKLCPTCDKEVNSKPGEKGKDWDNDHDPAWRDRDLSDKNRKEVIDEYNRGTRLRCVNCNRSDNGK